MKFSSKRSEYGTVTSVADFVARCAELAVPTVNGLGKDVIKKEKLLQVVQVAGGTTWRSFHRLNISNESKRLDEFYVMSLGHWCGKNGIRRELETQTGIDLAYADGGISILDAENVQRTKDRAEANRKGMAAEARLKGEALARLTPPTLTPPTNTPTNGKGPHHSNQEVSNE